MRNLNDFQEQLHLAMPVPAFLRSPRPQQPGPEESPLPQSSSRLSALHFNVRSIVNGSSIYSRSPNASNNNTPKIPFLGFMRRPQSPQPNTMADDNRPDSSDSRSPLRPQFRVESYIRVIEPLQYPSAEDGVIDRHPADVSLEYGASEDPEAQHTHDSVNHRRRRRHRRRKHTRSNRSTHWVRKKGFIKTHAARAKLCACIIAGLFLVTVLAVCTYSHSSSIVDSAIKKLTPTRSRPRPHTESHWSRNPRPLHNDHSRHNHLLLSLCHPSLHARTTSSRRDTADTINDRTRRLPSHTPDTCTRCP